jgi:hypothetical protein
MHSLISAEKMLQREVPSAPRAVFCRVFTRRALYGKTNLICLYVQNDKFVVKLPMAVWAEWGNVGDVVNFFPSSRVGEIFNGSNVASFDKLIIAANNAFFTKML